MWLNGQDQYDKHLAGKKHLRNTRCPTRHSTPQTTLQELSAPGPDTRCPTRHSTPQTTLQELPAPGPDEVHLLLYNIAGEEVGVVCVPSLAKWQHIAVAVALRYSHYQAIPPENPRAVVANELDGYLQVTIKEDPYEK
jgi:hypothetical protein